jgi:predicted enzyme related to lactoylglutathione lyase
MHGQFIWYELTTPDADASQKFYPRFTDWGTQRFDEDYVMWTLGGVPIAGIFRLTDEMRQQGVPPNWMPYVESSNVDETAKKATSLGGKVVAGPADIPNVGRYAVLQDPQGAVFGLYKSSGPSGAWDGTPVVGRFSWHELMTTDSDKAFDFYRALFGWEKTSEMDMGGGNMYTMYGNGPQMYGAVYNRPPEMAGVPPFWLMYIHVKDVGQAVKAATKAGATVKRPRMDIPGGTIAILGDPQGAAFALHDLTPAAAAAKQTPAAAKSPAKKAAKKAVKKAAKSVVKKAAKKVAKAASPKAKARRASKPKPKAKSKARAKAKTVTKAAARKKSAPKRRTGKPKAKKR